MDEQKKLELMPIQEIISSVTDKMRTFISNKELIIPADYSAENALKSAWLMLQTTEDRNHQPVLKVCTQSSIAISLMDMVIQNLNPQKQQCYFIAYGKTLVCQRSYHGSRAIVISICKAKDINAQVVWGKDEFEYEIEMGVKKIRLHRQNLDNVGKDPKAAYCIILLSDNRVYTDIMTIEQVHKSWEKSSLYKEENSKCTHNQFPEEMIRRTVINRACKKYINSSSDDRLFLESFNRLNEVREEYDLDREIEANANKEPIDVRVDHSTGEVLEDPGRPKQEPGDEGNDDNNNSGGPDF